jgi:copper chaperone CopZ
MRTVRGSAYDSPSTMTTTHLKVYCLKDARAAQTAYSVLGQLEGVEQVHLDIALRRISVTHQAQPGLAESIVAALRAAGFRATPKR